MMSDVFVKYLSVIDSTNRYARNESATLWRMSENASMVVVYAGEQTAGRGQRGNVWHSVKDENLLMSILVRPSFLKVKEQFALSQVIALAVLQAMEEAGVESQLKWPNDIYVGDRKLAGILVELDCGQSCVEQAVIGVGLNVNQQQFPVMDKKPVSMSLLAGHDFIVDDILERVVASFSHYYERLVNGEHALLADEYKSHLIGYLTPMRYRDCYSEFMAEIVDVESCGRLLLQRSTGDLCRYFFKEVELIM